jgi:hypothetical protein
VKTLVLAVSSLLLLSTCAAYQAQHASAAPPPKRVATATVPAAAPAAETTPPAAHHAHAAAAEEPLSTKQALLISEIDKFQDELKANGQYDCCVTPACRQCAITAGECHCRHVISANGPCCGECTQAWVEGRGNVPGVDRETVLAHLGCVRELYERKTPDGVVAPAQRKDQ